MPLGGRKNVGSRVTCIRGSCDGKWEDGGDVAGVAGVAGVAELA